MNLTNSKCLINATSLLSLYRKLFTMTRKFNPENFNFLAIFLKFLFRKQQLAAKSAKFLIHLIHVILMSVIAVS